MFTLREAVLRMAAYVPGEAPRNDDVVKLNQNENAYPPSPDVARAVAEEALRLRLYPDSTSAALRRTAADLYGVPDARVMAVNGSDEWLRILFQACVNEGDLVVSFNPSYTYYRTLAAMQGARYRTLEFGADYELPDRPDFAGTKLVFLPNPNAPSGTLFPLADIERLCALAAPALVCVDEAYIDFAPDDATAIPLTGRVPNLLVARTFSKSYSLAGLRVGLGFGPEAVLAELEKVRDYYNVDRLAQAGAQAALADQAYFRDVRAKIIATRARTAEGLARLGAKVWPSHANFVLARFGGAAEAARLFAGLRERGVLVRYFSTPRLDDCLRVSIGTDAEMDRALAEFATLKPLPAPPDA